MNCAQHFFHTADSYPKNAAIIADGSSTTYSELKKEVIATVCYFESKGIRPGDRVLVFIPMSVDLYRVVLALFSMGATAVFLDEWVSKKRMEMCCEIANCRGFIGVTKAHIVRFFSKELRAIPVRLKIKHSYQADERFSLFEPSEDHSALITFTTGSTGTPKAANRTHAFLIAQFEAIRAKITPSPSDVVMPVLPIVLFINLGVGSTSVIYRYKSTKLSSIKPEEVFELIKNHEVNQLIASPSFVNTLANYSIDMKRPKSSLRTIYTGGAPVFPKEAKRFSEGFPEAKIEVIYGSTEAEPISAVPVDDLISSEGKQKGLLVGFPDQSAEVKIIPFRDEPIQLKENEALETLKSGEIGEIIVAGKHVLTSYFNNPEALLRAKIWEKDKIYHRTGDSGYLDANGQLYLVGRSTQAIKVNDQMIYPFIFEDEIQQIEEVLRGTILKNEHQILIVIELKDNAKREAVKSKLESKFDFPFELMVRKIPLDKRHHGKIDHSAILQIVRARQL